ncbi:head GIN domain-containing protein [Allosphingosinicella sp.]|uniref:head GIN domain-containing protein n=1 Tax=Allosphingosinicella sp. TaxID=2823234 RepID=UPI002FC0DF1B
MRAAYVLIPALTIAACGFGADAQEGEPNEADNRTAQRTFDVGVFDSVSLGGHHNVVVKVGPAASVRAEGPASEVERLKIEVKDGDLHIGTKKDRGWFGSSGSRRPVTVYVTTPILAGAAIGGSGDMRIDAVEGGSFSASIGGSGDMDIASLRVGSADFSIAGSGGIHAAGTATRTSVSIAGSGDVEIADLESQSADVSIVGSGGVRARAMESADVSIMGSGDVAISGSAKCSVSKMGSGDVRCGG